MKQQCWEFNRCGWGPDGPKSRELGACPAATDVASHGVNGGRAGGRQCWTVEGTRCDHHGGSKFGACLLCPFFRKVEREEERFFVLGL